MKYLLLIYQNPVAWDGLSSEEREAIMHEATAIVDELTCSGEWIGGEGLARASKAARVRGGTPAVTDGPYLEAKEHLAGYCLFECDTEERALEIATRWPDARDWGVELRSLMSSPDE